MTNQPHMIDLREMVEKHLGKPLAASTNAALWRCPVCPPERHSLLLVSANQHKCLGRCVCDGGASEWMRSEEQLTDELIMLEETA